MVSIKTGLTVAAVAVAALLFIGAGGFKGVGSKIGGSISDLSTGFTSGLGSLFGGAVSTITGGESRDTSTGTIGPAPRTGTEEFDPLGNLIGNFKGLQNILDTINNFFTGGGATPQPQFTAPAFNDPQSTRDFNLIQQTQRVLGRPINVERSVAAQRELGNTPFAVVIGDRTRTFATESTARSFLERINR